ncbi:MAG: 30S ribosomal protein S8 [Candidatus Hydrogenedentota bacterium]
MVMTDPIADMLTRIRNANKERYAKVDIPSSRLKIGIAKILKEEGFIKHFKIVKNDKRGIIRIFLKYNDEGEPVIHQLVRISRPGGRVYVKSADIRPVMAGVGIEIISTSKGLMTNSKAKKNNLGGERICVVY